MRLSTIARLPFLLGSLLLAPQIVFAQEAGDEMEAEEGLDLVDLMNIEVTVASLFAESWVDTAAAVSTIDEKAWTALGARSIPDAIGNFQSIMPLSTTGGAHALPIRGFANSQSVRGIATQLDGVPLNSMSFGTALYHLPHFEIGTLGRIEMIRGPGSTLYGSDAFHGVLSLRTYSSNEDEVSISSEGGSLGFMRLSVRGSQEIAPGLRLTTALGANAQNSQGLSYLHDDPVSGRRMSRRRAESEGQSANIKLEYEVSEMVKVSAGGYLHRFDSLDFLGGGGAGYNGAFANLYMGRAGVEFKLPMDIGLDVDGYYWQGAQELEFQSSVPSPAGGFMPVSICLGGKDSRAGARLTFKMPDFLNTQWSARYEFGYMGVDDTRQDAVPVGGCRDYQPKSPSGYEGLNRNIHSILAQTKTNLYADMLYVVIGLRGDIYSDFGGQFTPRGGLLFKPTEDSAIKALYARAFRAPVAGELRGAGGILLGNEDLKPEIIDTFELIYSQSSDNWKLSFGGFLSFWQQGVTVNTNISDEQRMTGATGQYANNGELESHGVEAEATYSSDGWRTSFSASYVRSYDVTERPEGQPHPLAAALMLQAVEDSGQLFGAFPAFILNTEVGYHFADLGLTVDLTGRVLVEMAETPANIRANAPKLPVYAMVNASVSKSVGDLDIQLVLRNLLDQRNELPNLWGGTVGGVRSQGVNGGLRLAYKF